MKDPMFLHELIAQNKANQLRYFKTELKNIEKMATMAIPYNLARDIAIEIGYLGYEVNLTVYVYSGCNLSLNLLKDDTITCGVNQIMDICELMFKDTEYNLDVDSTKQDNAFYYIKYTNGNYQESIRLDIYIATSKHCKQITASRMEEVTEYICEES
ncbi:MAG: hypothetical protein PF440_11925 [Thiomicrorhabdus sp.]|jgi:hypothetical protein|nr:hypothetical protein [Thiomicrorhabdus sp.]